MELAHTHTSVRHRDSVRIHDKRKAANQKLQDFVRRDRQHIVWLARGVGTCVCCAHKVWRSSCCILCVTWPRVLIRSTILKYAHQVLVTPRVSCASCASRVLRVTHNFSRNDKDSYVQTFLFASCQQATAILSDMNSLFTWLRLLRCCVRAIKHYSGVPCTYVRRYSSKRWRPCRSFSAFALRKVHLLHTHHTTC